MYCINCGKKVDDGKHICKGCSSLSAGLRDELLALSEKTADSKCKKCGGDVRDKQHYCGSCGEQLIARA